MQERASLLGGKVTIESTPGTGTTVYVEMPLEQENGIHELNQDSAALSR
jgi:signal transduction histidine kinase